jgi:tetratricopeptide (TPR) repeat protein
MAAFALLVTAARALPPSAPGGLEPAIERQLLDAKAAVDRLSADGSAGPGDLATAYGSLGELYSLYDLASEAESCLREAIARDTREPRWQYLLGVVLEGEGELEGAAEAFRATLALRADDVPALLRLGDVSLDRAQAEEARAAFARALALERSAKALDGLGRVAFAQGDYDQAIARFEAALALQPEASSVHYRLGMAHRARGDKAAARRHLEQGGEKPVTFPDPVLDAAHRRVTGVGASIVVGQLAARAGATATAEARFREAVTLDPESPEAHHEFVALY